jgi:hypothetical protein
MTGTIKSDDSTGALNPKQNNELKATSEAKLPKPLSSEKSAVVYNGERLESLNDLMLVSTIVDLMNAHVRSRSGKGFLQENLANFSSEDLELLALTATLRSFTKDEAVVLSGE